jgi:glutathione gamma-glutamylcysteinyltransferase
MNRQLQVPKETFYKRELPPTCISFDSSEGKRLFRVALDEDNMETYFPLSMQYLTQSEPAFCGVSSLCMVLNALNVDPCRKWKGLFVIWGF